MKNESQLQREKWIEEAQSVFILIKKDALTPYQLFLWLKSSISSHDQELMRELKEKVEKIKTTIYPSHYGLEKEKGLIVSRKVKEERWIKLEDVLELFNQKEI